jgi:hypothetical protein
MQTLLRASATTAKKPSSSVARRSPSLSESPGHEHDHQRTLGNLTVLRLTGEGSSPPPETGKHAWGASWDFSKIPIFPPDRPFVSGTSPAPAPLLIQRKLAIGEVNDPLEHEADRVADHVMRMSEPQIQRKCACGGTCPECSEQSCEQERGPVRMKHIGPPGPALAEAPPIVYEVLRSPGQPLDQATRAFMEPRFGHDLSGVRIHTHAAAAKSAKDINAHAYTSGHNIVFGSGKYTLASFSGRHLIAHELAHVIQQSRIGETVQRSPDDRPATDPRWRQDEKAARYRGKLLADRILHHGKLSEDARTKIKNELAYFEGSARDAYIAQIKPALEKVGKTDVIASDTKAKAPSQSASSPAPSDFIRRMTSDPRYIDNDISKVSFYGAELAIVYYHDGSSLELGLSPKWMKPPFVEVDYHTAREDLAWFSAPDRQSIFHLKEIPPDMPYGEMQKHAYPVDFAALAVKGGARVVPSRVNMLTAPVLCNVLRHSEEKYEENVEFVVEFGIKVAGVVGAMSGLKMGPRLPYGPAPLGKAAARGLEKRATQELESDAAGELEKDVEKELEKDTTKGLAKDVAKEAPKRTPELGPSAPAGWRGSLNAFGQKIRWPRSGKIEVPADAVNLEELRSAGVTETWAAEQAQIYREVARLNPKNPTAVLRAEWLEKIAVRLRGGS